MNPSLHVYDCANDPLNFEFVPWLVRAEMIRRQHGGDPPLRIAFANYEDVERRRPGWLAEVMRPLLPMLGAVEDYPAPSCPHCGARSGKLPRVQPWEPWNQPFQSVEHIEQDIGARHARGEQVPLLTSTEKPLRPGHIVITLREASHWPHRNSNLEAWLAFADDLQDAGEQVMILRGHEKADERLPPTRLGVEGAIAAGKPIMLGWPWATRHLTDRMALYSGARMNFFVSDGPAMLCFFSNAPYVAFMTHYAGHQGPQRPWAIERQRTVYARDTHEAIQGAWEAAKRTTARRGARPRSRAHRRGDCPCQKYAATPGMSSWRLTGRP